MLNTLVGFSRITGFASIYLAGHLADKFGYRIVLASILVFTSVLTVLIGTVSGPLLLIAVFLQPAATQSFFPATLSAITRTAKPEARNLAVSLSIPLSNILGGGLTPMTLGAAGYFSMSFIILGSLGLLSVFLLKLLPATIEERC
jgi:MFS family permease